jgi:hypothetical protein
VRRHVAVHDRRDLAVGAAPLVRGGQRGQDPDADGGDQIPARVRLSGIEPVDVGAEVDAVDPLLDQVVLAVLLHEVVDRRDVGAGHGGQHARLLGEHVDVHLALGQVVVHLFHRDGARETDVAVLGPAPHHCHAAAPGDLMELVAPPDAPT